MEDINFSKVVLYIVKTTSDQTCACYWFNYISKLVEEELFTLVCIPSLVLASIFIQFSFFVLNIIFDSLNSLNKFLLVKIQNLLVWFPIKINLKLILIQSFAINLILIITCDILFLIYCILSVINSQLSYKLSIHQILIKLI